MSVHVPTGVASLTQRDIFSLFAGMKKGDTPGQRVHERASEVSVDRLPADRPRLKGNMYDHLAAIYDLPEGERAAAAAAAGGAVATAFAYVEATESSRDAVVAGIRVHAQSGRPWDGTVRIGGNTMVIGSNATPEQARAGARQQAEIFNQMLEHHLRMYAGSAFGGWKVVSPPTSPEQDQPAAAEGDGRMRAQIDLDAIAASMAERSREWLLENGVYHLDIARTSEGDMVLEYAVRRTFSSRDYTYAEHGVTVEASGRWTWDRDGDGFTVSPTMSLSRHGWDMTPGLLIDVEG